MVNVYHVIFLNGNKQCVMDKSFIDEFNEVSVRNTKNCRCKICDREITDKSDLIVYLKSFRLQAQPLQICIPCWRRLNILVEEELKKRGYANEGI